MALASVGLIEARAQVDGEPVGGGRPALAFTLLTHETPGVGFAGARRRIPLRLRNDGAETWSEARLDRVSYAWLGRDDRPVPDLPDSVRTGLVAPVAPGEVLTLDAGLALPDRPGVYHLRWDLVREGVAWFAGVDPTPVAPVRIIVLPSLTLLLWTVPLLLLGAMAARAVVRRGRRAPPPIPPPTGVATTGPLAVAALVLLAVVSCVTATMIRGGRDTPTILGDEALYTYKARNYADHGSYFAPPGVPDVQHVSAPLYSVFLAPILKASGDVDTAFPWFLLLNALLHASMLIPAWHLASASFPAQRWLIALAVALWTIPASYSLSLMSEALFVPLFLWTGWLWTRAAAVPRVSRFVAIGLAVAGLTLTRFNGIAMVGVLAVAWVTVFDAGRVRRAPWATMVVRAPMVVIPVVAWLLLRWSRSGHERQPIHALLDYAARSVVTLEGRFTAADYGRIWLGQLAYLNVATFGLFGMLLVATVVAARRWWRARAPKASPDGLMPLPTFWVLAILAMLAAASVFMFNHLRTGKPRFWMYGRYVDVAVPLVLIYGLGLRQRIGAWLVRHRTRWLMAAVAVALVVGLFQAVPEIGDVRAINPGAAWLQGLQNAHGLDGWVVAGPCVAWLLLLVTAGRRWWSGGALVAVLVTASVLNTRQVERSHRYYAATDADRWHHLDALAASGGRFYYHRHHLDDHRLLFLAKYEIYDRVVTYEVGDPVDFTRDVFLTESGLVSAQAIREGTAAADWVRFERPIDGEAPDGGTHEVAQPPGTR